MGADRLRGDAQEVELAGWAACGPRAEAFLLSSAFPSPTQVHPPDRQTLESREQVGLDPQGAGSSSGRPGRSRLLCREGGESSPGMSWGGSRADCSKEGFQGGQALPPASASRWPVPGRAFLDL